MILTSNEQRVLGIVEFAPHLTAEEVARRTRMKTSTVAAVLRRLESSGIIWHRAFIDPMRLGLQDIGMQRE